MKHNPEMTADRPSKETVIVVHGTFSEKNADCSNWYAPKQSFCAQLDRQLQTAGSTARCWKHLKPDEDFFHWDGRNDWFSRTRAAVRLRRQVHRLVSDGWVVHLVGHSHGGNIIIEAIMNRSRRVRSWFNGRVVLLGTPIYSSSHNYQLRKLFRLTVWLLLSLACWFFLTWLSMRNTDIAEVFSDETTATFRYAVFMTTVAAFAVLLLLIRICRYLESNYQGILDRFFPFLWSLKLRWQFLRIKQGLIKPFDAVGRSSPHFMLINSRYDEAFKSLSELQKSANPFLREATFETQNNENITLIKKIRLAVGSVRSGLEITIKNTLEISNLGPMSIIGTLLILTTLYWDRLTAQALSIPLNEVEQSLLYLTLTTGIVVLAVFFRKAFGAVFFFPGLVAIYLPIAIAKITKATLFVMLDGVLKNMVWGFVKAFSLGVNGAPNRTKDIVVGLEFDWSFPEDYLYLELPIEIVERVKQSQKPLLNEMQELLYKQEVSWSPSALKKELSKIEFPMIHTVYYREMTCIKKMAAWISEPIRRYIDGNVRPFEPLHVFVSEGREQGRLEEYEGPNEYQWHLKRLKEKHGTWRPEEQA
ncbi:MAG: esterase/lipase family protein [Gammaproteobacteria bacterium]